LTFYEVSSKIFKQYGLLFIIEEALKIQTSLAAVLFFTQRQVHLLKGRVCLEGI